MLSLRSLFGLSPQSIHAQSQKSASASSLPPEWRCTATIKPKSDAVRDVKWSPSDDNIFAIVTASGYLIVYNLRLLGRPWLKIAVHSGEATCVDWHPRRKFILATASGRERSIKGKKVKLHHYISIKILLFRPKSLVHLRYLSLGFRRRP